MTTTVKRSLIASFLNTGTVVSPTWSIIGLGVTTGKIAYNPKTLQEIYINADTGTTLVESYMPNMPIEASVYSGDPVFDYVDAMRQARSVLASAQSEVVNVWKYTTPALGYYQAERQTVAIQLEEFGGAGGEVAKIKFTLDYMGTPTLGAFNASTLAFTPDPVSAVLATMVIGAVTLTPLFSADHTWLYYAGSVAASTVTMTSTCTASGATVVQKDNVGTTVNQAAAASLSMGVNHLTITVTVGTEVVIYAIDITRTA